MSRIDRLKDRAHMLSVARKFFEKRRILEVDCPILNQAASIDAHIDPITTSKRHYLHTSPEYGMKRLLTEGIGDIYQLSHVFRDGEQGSLHNPEFMMCEWYRTKISFTEMIEETLAFIMLFLGDLPHTTRGYRAIFQDHINPDATREELLDFLSSQGITVHSSAEDRDSLLNIIMGCVIQPHLGKEELCVITHYPLNQAALARTTTVEGEEVAERFEVFYQGVELANGYNELCDAQEQHRRLREANALRTKMGKEPLPVDHHFLKALQNGMPRCCGVAAGFDRLMMLRHHQGELADILPFPWNY